MGYTTNFKGSFTITPALSPFLRTFLKKLATTRRMRRRAPEALYGVEGEFFVDGHGFMGQGDDTPESCPILDHNTPPSTQPGLWLQWVPNTKGTALKWDGGEKFYEYDVWLEYLIQKILQPNGYTINGEVRWEGEDHKDLGTLVVKNNVLTIKRY